MIHKKSMREINLRWTFHNATEKIIKIVQHEDIVDSFFFLEICSSKVIWN